MTISVPLAIERKVPAKSGAPKLGFESLAGFDSGRHLALSRPSFAKPLQRMRMKPDFHIERRWRNG